MRRHDPDPPPARARALRVATLGGVLLSAACGAVGEPPPPPGPIQAPPTIDVAPTPPADAMDTSELPVPDLEAWTPHDEILHSSTVDNPDFARDVDRWVTIWLTVDALRLPAYLRRMAVYDRLVDGVLEEEGLPRSLRYLPFIESGYSPVAVSRVSAVGLWQFMAPTAREMGLRVTPLVDERRDPVRSTRAAARYLAELRARLGSWFLALAAYNGGPNRVARLLSRHAPDATPGDDLYLAIRPHLPRETREFVAKFLAAARIAADPRAFGVEVPANIEPLGFEEVLLEDAASVDVIARAAGTSEAVIRELNPHLVRGFTPGETAVVLRVPPGLAEGFEARWALVPPDERVTIVMHRVAAGETLSHVAVAYGTTVAELTAANPGIQARRLQIGQSLLVPRPRNP